jgi:hypothetical protein
MQTIMPQPGMSSNAIAFVSYFARSHKVAPDSQCEKIFNTRQRINGKYTLKENKEQRVQGSPASGMDPRIQGFK